MTAHMLHLTIHGETRTLTITGDTTTDLAAAIHRHARGQLGGSRVDIHLDGPGGTITSHGAGVGTFTLEPVEAEPQPTDQPAETDGIRWGWTLGGIDSVTRHVLNIGRWHAADLDEHHDAVRHAIIEHLLTAESAPSRRDLMAVGLRAADDRVAREMHHHGWNKDNLAAGPGGMRSYQRYWTTTPTPSPENLVVDRLAVAQIWPLLTHRQQRAIEVLRDTGDYQQSAHLLNLDPANSYPNLLSAARRRFYQWWHQGEQPSRIWRADKRVGARDGTCRGVPRLTVSQVEEMRRRRQEGALLRELAAEAGVGISTVSRFLRGDVRPAPDPVSEAAA